MRPGVISIKQMIRCVASTGKAIDVASQYPNILLSHYLLTHSPAHKETSTAYNIPTALQAFQRPAVRVVWKRSGNTAGRHAPTTGLLLPSRLASYTHIGNRLGLYFPLRCSN